MQIVEVGKPKKKTNVLLVLQIINIALTSAVCAALLWMAINGLV